MLMLEPFWKIIEPPIVLTTPNITMRITVVEEVVLMMIVAVLNWIHPHYTCHFGDVGV